MELAQGADVKSLAIFHLYPGHDDASLKASEAEMQAIMPTAFIARERQVVAFEPADREVAPARLEPALAQAGEH